MVAGRVDCGTRAPSGRSCVIPSAVDGVHSDRDVVRRRERASGLAGACREQMSPTTTANKSRCRRRIVTSSGGAGAVLVAPSGRCSSGRSWRVLSSSVQTLAVDCCNPVSSIAARSFGRHHQSVLGETQYIGRPKPGVVDAGEERFQLRAGLAHCCEERTGLLGIDHGSRIDRGVDHSTSSLRSASGSAAGARPRPRPRERCEGLPACERASMRLLHDRPCGSQAWPAHVASSEQTRDRRVAGCAFEARAKARNHSANRAATHTF